MKSFQERLFNDFDVKLEQQENGKVKRVYVYKGDYASWDLNEEMLKRYRRLYAAAGLLLCALYIWKSVLRTPMNADGIVGGFTMLSFVALMILVIGLWNFVFAKKEMYIRDTKQMIPLIMGGSIAFALFQAATAAAAVLFLIRNRVDTNGILILIGSLISALLSGCLFLAQKKLTYSERKGSGGSAQDN